MCDICIMNAVKDRMMSRRSFFGATAAATAAATIGGIATAPKALAAGHAGIFDMTHMLDETFPTWAALRGLPMRRLRISRKTDTISTI